MIQAWMALQNLIFSGGKAAEATSLAISKTPVCQWFGASLQSWFIADPLTHQTGSRANRGHKVPKTSMTRP